VGYDDLCHGESPSKQNLKKIICLNIPDEYEFMQPELIKLLEAKVGGFFRKN